MKRKINFEVLFQLIILVGLAILLVFALVSGKTEGYVHPRLNIYLWFSVPALLLIAFFMLPSLFQPKRCTHMISYLIVLFPLLTAVLVPAGIVNSKSISLGDAGASSQKSSAVSSKSQTLTSAMNTPSSAALPKADKNGIIQISDELFSKWYTDMNQNMQQAAGKVYRFKGQVFHVDYFAANEFVPMRKAMVCCAADLQPCGILCRSEQAKSFKNDEWVWVTATVKIETYRGETMPVAYVTKIEKADKPKEEYIYFAY